VASRQLLYRLKLNAGDTRDNVFGVVTQVLAVMLFVVFAIVLPGVAIMRALRLPVEPSLVLPAGLVLSSVSYGVSLILGFYWLYPVVVIGLDLTLLRARRHRTSARGPSLKGVWPFFAIVVALLAVTQYGENRMTREGSFVLDSVLPEDAVFHVGLAQELAHEYPPQVPGLSGFTLDYHFGHPLIRAAMLRFAGISPWDALSRIDNTLAALALLLALRAVTATLGGASRAVTLIGFALIASDLSFLLAWNQEVRWWLGLCEGSYAIVSMTQSNAVIPALALSIGCVVAFARFHAGEGRGWLVLAALLSAGVPFFKIFTAIHLGLGWSVAVLVSNRRRELVLFFLPTLAVMAFLALGSAGARVEIALDPLLSVHHARRSLGLAPLDGWDLIPWAGLWIVVGLGLRVCGLPEAWRALRSRAAPAVMLSVMALAGWPLGMLLRISPVESGHPYNEALYFFEQSGVLLWIFTALALGRLGLHGVRNWVAGVLCALAALPTTAHFAWTKATQKPMRIPAEIVRGMEALSHDSRPGDVVLQRPLLMRFPPPPLVLARRRVPFTGVIPYFNQFVPRREVERRRSLVKLFFRISDDRRALEIARSLRATHVCLFGSDALAFDPRTIADPIFEAETVRVYRIRR
jgi:hypothetical protein